MLLSTLLMIVTLVASEPIAPTARTRYPYWQMIEDVVKQIESQPVRPLSINDGLRTPGQEYPFESFRHLRAVDLLRAAREGVTVARKQEALGKPPAEVEQSVMKNIMIALEYLPLVMRDHAEAGDISVAQMQGAASKKSENRDAEEILLIIKNRDEDPLLRRFLLERTIPGFVSPSLLSLALPVFIQARDQQFREALSAIASHPGEDPLIQVLAIEVFLHYAVDQYEEAFENDSNVQRLLASGEPLTYTAAADRNPPELSSETQARLRTIAGRMGLFAESIAGHIGEGSRRDERVKARTREAIEFMRDKIAGVDKAVLEAYLAGNAPEPKSMWPVFPATPEPTLDLSGQGGVIPIELPADGGPPQF